MKFLKNMRADGAPEELAVAARLNAVTGRGKMEGSDYPFIEQRQRWSPREVQTVDE